MLWRREKSLASAGNWAMILHTPSPGMKLLLLMKYCTNHTVVHAASETVLIVVRIVCNITAVHGEYYCCYYYCYYYYYYHHHHQYYY
jgi:hypothetical protein